MGNLYQILDGAEGNYFEVAVVIFLKGSAMVKKDGLKDKRKMFMLHELKDKDTGLKVEDDTSHGFKDCASSFLMSMQNLLHNFKNIRSNKMTMLTKCKALDGS